MYTTERRKMLDNANKICSGNVDLNLLFLLLVITR